LIVIEDGDLYWGGGNGRHGDGLIWDISWMKPRDFYLRKRDNRLII
jgi:hypothetical protein